jgi:hypothetical protein
MKIKKMAARRHIGWILASVHGAECGGRAVGARRREQATQSMSADTGRGRRKRDKTLREFW